MKIRRNILILGICLLNLPRTGVAATADERGSTLIAALHKTNSVQSVTVNDLRRLFLGEMKSWPHQRRVTLVYVRSAGSDYSPSLLDVLKMSAVEYRRFLLNAEFRGESPLTLKALDSIDSACKFVSNVPGAVLILKAAASEIDSCQQSVKVVGLQIPEKSAQHQGGHP